MMQSSPDSAAAILVQTLLQHDPALQSLLRGAAHSSENSSEAAQAAAKFLAPYYQAMLHMVGRSEQEDSSFRK
jgi:hypothetical protein